MSVERIKELAHEIAQTVRNGYFYAGDYSGFRAQSADDLERLLIAFAAELRDK